MNPGDRYIDDVMRNVFATPEDRERLEADLRSHFDAGETDGGDDVGAGGTQHEG